MRRKDSMSASQYPISQFLDHMLEDTGLDLAGFVISLGYRNLERGLRRLEPWLNVGDGYEKILRQIASAYPGEADGLWKGVAETAAIKRAEADAAFLERCKSEQATFVPFVYAEGTTTVP